MNHTNDTVETDDSKSGIYQQFFILIASIGVGLISLILNILAAIVFHLKVNNPAYFSIRILVVIEIHYTLLRITADSLWLVEKTTYFSLLLLVIDTSIVSRNCWIAVLSLYRCFAICTPLSVRFIKGSQQMATVSIILVISICVALTRYYDLLYQSATVFLFQAGLPIPIVIVASVVMLVYLWKPGELTRFRSKMLRATRTVFFLALLFVVLEGPTFLTELIPSLQRFPLINPVCNLLTILDSASNLLVLVCCSQHFREHLSSFFTHGCKIVHHSHPENRGNPQSLLCKRGFSQADKSAMIWKNESNKSR